MVHTALQPTESIKKNIYDVFYWDTRIDHSNINVEVGQDGKVVLSGSVANYPSRRYAVSDARSVPGVKSVEDRLNIKFNDNLAIPSDREVESNIRDVIHWNSNVDESKIKVSVNAGYVTLEGTVRTYYQKFRAQELAEDTIGVLRLDNRLTVVPEPSRTDEEIAGKVIGSLKNTLGLDADSLTVMVKGGIVTLTGTVRDIISLQAVENIVRYTRGVVDVHDLMVIAEPPR